MGASWVNAEAYILKELADSKFVVWLDQASQDEEMLYLVTEHLSGGDL